MTRPVLLLLALAVCPACETPEPEPESEPPIVPDGAHCEPVRESPQTLAEDTLLAEINALRARGGRCGPLRFLPAPALAFDPALRCAARLHTADMLARDFFGSVDPDGIGPGPRLAAAQYPASSFAENVGFARTTAEDPDQPAAAADITTTWADNPSTCWKLYAREFTAIGIGAAPVDYAFKDMDPAPGLVFTATFAAP